MAWRRGENVFLFFKPPRWFHRQISQNLVKHEVNNPPGKRIQMGKRLIRLLASSLILHTVIVCGSEWLWRWSTNQGWESFVSELSSLQKIFLNFVGLTFWAIIAFYKSFESFWVVKSLLCWFNQNCFTQAFENRTVRSPEQNRELKKGKLILRLFRWRKASDGKHFIMIGREISDL